MRRSGSVLLSLLLSNGSPVALSLKEFFGGRFVRVRGGAKVMHHLMFGLIAMAKPLAVGFPILVIR
jgi:hypothetical protein